MHIFIAGGSGYIGTYLCQHFLAHGHRVTATGSRRVSSLPSSDLVTYIRADTTKPGDWQKSLKNCHVIINLAGKTIFRHWTDRYKKEMYHSRIMTTKNIVSALPKTQSVLLCSASAVGYYGSQEDKSLTESASLGDDFLAHLARDWEAEAMAAQNEQTRVAILRFGIILSRNGGAMAKMIPAFKLFMGGPFGDGRQWFPWMHLKDVAGAIDFIIENSNISGPINFCSPHPVRNRELVRMLARALSRPALMRIPSFALRLVLGEFGETLLASQRATPEKLVQNGYKFEFDRIENAIAEILNPQKSIQ